MTVESRMDQSTTDRESVILNYIEGYNQFDVDKMVANFDGNIVFENVQGGEVTMSLLGLAAFKEQAEQAKTYFTTRTQTIQSWEHRPNETEITIDYQAVLAMDFPNGLKKGQALQLTGKSIFVFLGDKIVKITDVS